MCIYYTIYYIIYLLYYLFLSIVLSIILTVYLFIGNRFEGLHREDKKSLGVLYYANGIYVSIYL
jgi:hypothetical protein